MSKFPVYLSGARWKVAAEGVRFHGEKGFVPVGTEFTLTSMNRGGGMLGCRLDGDTRTRKIKHIRNRLEIVAQTKRPLFLIRDNFHNAFQCIDSNNPRYGTQYHIYLTLKGVLDRLSDLLALERYDIVGVHLDKELNIIHEEVAPVTPKWREIVRKLKKNGVSVGCELGLDADQWEAALVFKGKEWQHVPAGLWEDEDVRAANGTPKSRVHTTRCYLVRTVARAMDWKLRLPVGSFIDLR